MSRRLSSPSERRDLISVDDTVAPTPRAPSLDDTAAPAPVPASLEDTAAPVAAIDPLSETGLPPAIDPLSDTGISREPPRRRPRSAAAASLEIGASIGRYTVVDFLGAGGMGAVYAAYDPELDRKVALKVLLHAGAGDIEQRKRLLREAQALARLQHPQVVAVHDVGEHDGRVFVAMEFVRGQTLSRWMRAQPTAEAIVRVFVDAGRGLAAAHAHGLVHRDFKPDNVMIDEQGRVRVMDFGLARTSESVTTEMTPVLDSSASSSMLELELSTTGTVLGTPAYMAPEQFGGSNVDARSDQFSFCAALFEAFAGTRPFTGTSVHELAANVCSGKLDETAAAKLPGRIRRIVLRGLGVDPQLRYPTMDVLLVELARDPRRTRRAVALVALGALGLGGAVLSTRAVEDRTCLGGREAVAAVWNDEQQQAITGAFTATALPYADTARMRVLERLGGFAEDYQRAHQSTCEATEVRHEQSTELMDDRMRCLARRFDDFSATVELLAHADAGIVERAHEITDALPSLARCDDVDFVTAEVAPPDDPEVAARVDDVRQVLARARARRIAARLDDASELVDEAEGALPDIGYAPLVLEVAAERSDLDAELGEHEHAARGYEQVFFAARGIGLDRLRAVAALELVYLHGFALAKPELGRQWARHSGAENDVAGELADRIRLLTYLASLEKRAGDTALALALLRDALRLQVQSLGEDDLQVAHIHNNLCTLQNTRGQHDDAELHCRRALEIRILALGEDHPRVADTINNIGAIQYARGDTEAALASFERSAAIVARSVGEDRPPYARALNNIGAIHQARGENREAAENYQRALAIWSAALGPRHPDVAMVLNNLGVVAATQEEARDLHERALAIREEVGGPDHPEVAESLNNLGSALQKLGDQEGALQRFERARAILAAKGSADNPRLGLLDLGIGSALAELGRTDEAIAAYERARPVLEKGDPSGLGQLQYLLGRLLYIREPARGRAMVEQAQQTLAGRPGGAVTRSAEIDKWLATHRGR